MTASQNMFHDDQQAIAPMYNCFYSIIIILESSFWSKNETLHCPWILWVLSFEGHFRHVVEPRLFELLGSSVEINNQPG